MRPEEKSGACGATLPWEFTWHHSALPVPLHEKRLGDSDIRNGKSGTPPPLGVLLPLPEPPLWLPTTVPGTGPTLLDFNYYQNYLWAGTFTWGDKLFVFTAVVLVT